MSYSDQDLVNFGEDHELDYILRKFGMQLSDQNRNMLRKNRRALQKKTLQTTTNSQRVL